MDKTLCGVSALRYSRVPPRYLYALPCLPDFDTPSGRRLIRESFLATDVLGLPLNALELGGRRLHPNVVAPRLWSSGLPVGAIVDTPFDFAVTSPVLTLLMVSPYVSIVHLALLIYEFVGTFTVFAPSPELEEIYREAIGGIRRISLDDWRRVAGDVIAKERGIAADRSGSATGSDLWSRPALLTLDELDAFIEANAGMHGIKNLALARRYVTGVTAESVRGARIGPAGFFAGPWRGGFCGRAEQRENRPRCRCTEDLRLFICKGRLGAGRRGLEGRLRSWSARARWFMVDGVRRQRTTIGRSRWRTWGSRWCASHIGRFPRSVDARS